MDIELGRVDDRWMRLGRVAAIAITSLLLVVAVLEAVVVLGAVTDPNVTVGLDLRMYLDRTADWRAGDGFYLPHQLAGPYEVTHGDNMYPPVLLYLTVPMTVLPWAVWWLVPLAVIGAAVAVRRPSPWQLAALALILIYPRTWTILLYGNPALWALAALAAGMVWTWPLVGVPLKATFAPLALLGIRSRAWWAALGVAALLALPFGLMWLDYATVLVNAQSSRGLEYTLGEWPIALLLVLGLLRFDWPERHGKWGHRDGDLQRA